MIAKAQIRCAVYTRKSTEEGLEQEYNSLDAQRDAGEAFIASQKSEGWVCLADRYDDGGFTGGNMDRPALQRLLADIGMGKVDCIVVYKVDRLSRSLIDFARIMDTLDQNKVSFVSVTQQFNTSTSMGRLMLNVLLSFAQFEREIISERTRDKIAATRRKGKWAGGLPMLGYDVAEGGGKLLVNDTEAARVRDIFAIYLERESLIETAEVLNKRGWTMKKWTTREGNPYGGATFSKNNLLRLLTNPVYTGQVRFKNELYPGEHEAIVDGETYSRVQVILKRNGRSGSPTTRNKFGALLRGLLRCAPCDCGMTHSFAVSRTKRYRYYQCANAQARGWAACPTPSVPAAEIETFVVEQIRKAAQSHDLVLDTLVEGRRQYEESLDRLANERQIVERDLRRHGDALDKAAKETTPAGADWLADLNERIRLGEQRLGQIAAENEVLSRKILTHDEVKKGCEGFDALWESLTVREQVRLVNLLIRQVIYDGAKGTVSITFHPTGIKELVTQEQS